MAKPAKIERKAQQGIPGIHREQLNLHSLLWSCDHITFLGDMNKTKNNFNVGSLNSKNKIVSQLLWHHVLPTFALKNLQTLSY